MIKILDFIFPPVCLACGKFGQAICSQCIAQIKIHQGLICPFCLQKSVDGQKHSKCGGNIDGLVAVWDYEQTVQKIIKQIKYQGYFATVGELVRLNITYLSKNRFAKFYQFLETKPVLIPIPLHPKRYRHRGFNQAEKIAKAFSRNRQLPMSKKILIRRKYTQPQADLTKQARQKNIQNAFAPSSEILKLGEKPLVGKNIVLIDDVWTTGSTMQECAKVLKSLGAEKIWALTLAR